MATSSSSTVRPSHHALSSHSIFIPPSPSPQPEDEWEIVDNPAGPSVGQKSQRVIIRDKDLIVAFGSEIRITSLVQREWKLGGGKLGSYTILKSPHLTFDIQQLCLNPTGRLLAVTGRSQAVVLALPRVSSDSGSASVQCKSFVVDSHSLSSSCLYTISKVDWHPWGESGQSLWILTSDGKLREYDLRQPDDPIQTFSFLPTPITSPSRSRLTAIDPLSQYATSFAFFPADFGFGSSMVYVLTANGDIYVMGPILPFRTEMPLESLQRLKHRLDVQEGYGREWIEALIKQGQAWQAKGLSSHISASPRMQREGSTDSALGFTQEEPRPGCVRLRPPHLTASGGPAPGHHRPLLRQGPLVFSPGPIDDVEDEDDIASDLAWVKSDPASDIVLALAWLSGRVDFGLAVQPLFPRWLSSRDTTAETPAIAIIDSVKLDVPDIGDSQASPIPIIILDAAQPSRLVVQYSFCIDSISLRSEGTSLSRPVIDHVSYLFSSSKSFIGSVTFNDIALGYTALAVNTSGRGVAIELDLDASADETQPSPSHHADEQLPPFHSFVAKTLDYGELTESVRPLSDTRATANGMFSGKRFTAISADQLHKSGRIIASLQEQARSLTTASGFLEERFDLCMQEAHQQFQHIKNCRDDLDNLRDTKITPRAVRLLGMQVALANRLEIVVETLTAARRNVDQDGLKKWNEEIKAIEMEVGDAESGGLNGRMNSLREKLSTIKAGLAWAKDQPNSDPSPEQAQVDGLQTEVKDRSEEIRKLMRRMEGLSVRIDAAAEGRS